jgi:HlyD family secretion protein
MPLLAEQPPEALIAPSPTSKIVPIRKRHMPRWIFWIATVALLAAAGLYWRSYSQNKIVFETTPVERGTIQASITATGTLNPVVNVQVSSQVSGNIKALYADFNTRVKKGQLVALIGVADFPLIVQSAEALLSCTSGLIKYGT